MRPLVFKLFNFIFVVGKLRGSSKNILATEMIIGDEVSRINEKMGNQVACDAYDV